MREKIRNAGYFLKNFYNTKRKLSLYIIAGIAVFLLAVIILVISLRPPSPPEDLRAEVRSYDRVNLTWVDRQRNNSYNIYRSQELETDYEKIGSTRNQHYLDTSLQPETTYYYKVTAVSREKESHYSREVHATTGRVGAVENLHEREVGHNFIELGWDGFQESEGYVIYRTDSLDRPFAEIATTSRERYLDPDLETNKVYFYRVTQIIDGRETEHSEIRATTREWICGNPVRYDDYLYQTVKIADQCWFAENLNYETVEGSWCYADREENCEKDGRLYNWETAMAGSLEEGAGGLCPEGWHIPSDEDFKVMERNLGISRMESHDTGWRGAIENVGDKIKEARSCSQRGEAFCGDSKLNLSLGGSRSPAGAYRYLETHSFLWTSSSSDESAWRRLLALDNSGVHRDLSGKGNGFFVRCVRNL